MSKNMTILDRRLRAVLIAPVALLIGILIGAGSIAALVLCAPAAVAPTASTAGYCPLYSLIGTGGRHRQPQAH